ncbi:MAG: hypothetical protein OEX02_09215 [Cyclobacteriaceae bacterium]|nr:hypothetical protein [Cyclobacteriaceae bacterium]
MRSAHVNPSDKLSRWTGRWNSNLRGRSAESLAVLLHGKEIDTLYEKGKKTIVEYEQTDYGDVVRKLIIGESSYNKLHRFHLLGRKEEKYIGVGIAYGKDGYGYAVIRTKKYF